MADITIEGYVQERAGRRMRVTETHRRKNRDTGEWEDAGRTNYTCWLRKDDQQPEIQAGAVVLVSGAFSTKESEWKGERRLDLNVNVNSAGVVRLTSKYAGAQPAQPVRDTGWGQAQQPAQQWSGPGYDDSTPPF